MMQRLYLPAFSAGPEESPEVCLIQFDEQVVQRLNTLVAMIEKFKLESLSDHFVATWRDPKWETRFHKTAPLMFATATQCWWSVEVLNATGSTQFYTERVRIELLVQAYRDSNLPVIHYSERDAAAERSGSSDL